MRLIKRMTTAEGQTVVKVSVSTTEDLWHLYNFIVSGDHVRTKTRRKVVKESSIGSQSAEMKTINLEIEVKQAIFAPDEVRLQGVNCGESDFVKMGAHHTLTVHAFPPQEVTILKNEWNEIFDQRLSEACQQEGKADTIALVMDFGTASLLSVTPSFMYTKAKIDVTIHKKHQANGDARDKSIQRFFKQMTDAICSHVDMSKTKVLLICSPGSLREEYRQYLVTEATKADQGPLRSIYLNLSKIVMVKVTTGTHGAVREALSEPSIAAKMENTRCVADLRVWQEFQTMMNNDPNRCVYTIEYVYHAAMQGAVSTLMLTDALFRSEDALERKFYLSLLEFVRVSGARTFVFSSQHVTGEQLAQLGNAAAILSYPCPELDELEPTEGFMATEAVQEFVRNNASTSVTV